MSRARSTSNAKSGVTPAPKPTPSKIGKPKFVPPKFGKPGKPG